MKLRLPLINPRRSPLTLATSVPPLVPMPYLPRVSWFVTLSSFSTVSWHAAELYDKRQPRNRCRIAASGGPLELSVPLVNGRSQRAPLNKIEPLYNGKWQREHVHAIQTAYGRAPFFLYYADDLFSIMQMRYPSLAELNHALILLLLNRFGIVVSEHRDVTSTKAFEETKASIEYRQVFSNKTGFIPNCSAIDLLFNYGPDSLNVMKKYAAA